MAPPPSAAELKEQGNTKFKQRLYKEAANYYTKAEAAAPTEAVYPSNLSASLYELGDYASCYQAICRAANNLSDSEQQSTLFTRLSTRLAKTLSYGVRSGTITPESLRGDAGPIARLAEVVDAAGAGGEVVLAWKEWRRVEAEIERVGQVAPDARTRLSKLPIFKKPADPALEFFSLGTDDVLSIIDDWGLGEDFPLNVENLPPSRLSHLAFLFGGVGDGRHAYGSIVGIHRAFKKLSRSKKAQMRVHLTLLDIHPTVLARDLCIMLLLDELVRNEHDADTKVEIQATMFYVFSGVIIPSYCHARFHRTVKFAILNLQKSPPVLPAWLHIVDESIPAILKSLRHWETGMPNKTVRGMLEFHKGDETLEFIQEATSSPHIADNLKSAKDRERAKLQAMISIMPDEQLIKMVEPKIPERCPGPENPQKREKWLEIARSLIVEVMMAKVGEARPGTPRNPVELDAESLWYDKMRVFMPPTPLRARHEGFEELWAVVQDPKRRRNTPATKAIVKTAKAHVQTAWRPNSSLFDIIVERDTKYPNKNFDIFSVIKNLESFNGRFRLRGSGKRIDKDCPAFSVSETFFGAVVDALRELQGLIKVEVLHGDLSHELAKMRLQGDSTRPAEFPRIYTRMWLSNVPDYTGGPLNTAIYAIANSEDTPESAVAANCLLNTGSWETGEEFCYNYTHLFQAELPKYLGCRVLELDPWGTISLARLPTPIPLHELASYEELNTWLARILFTILVPGVPSQRAISRVYSPNNVVAFVDLLIHLHTVGFPSHWLSGALTAILTNTLTSDVAPYLGGLPIPSSERTRSIVARRKVNLAPWNADFENILAMSYEALPFPVALPSGFATSADDIGLFEVTAPNYMFMPSTMMTVASPYMPVMGLIFNKPGFSSVEHLSSNMHNVLEGKFGTNGKLQVLTVIEHCDIWQGIIRWRMSKERVKRMQSDGWVMSPYRFDIREKVSMQPFPASSWNAVEDKKA